MIAFADGFARERSAQSNGLCVRILPENRYQSSTTVYAVMLNGTEKVLYSFRGGSDGLNPNAALTNVNGTLYSTTDASPDCYSGGGGCGTVFSVSTSGVEKVLHTFGHTSDGKGPVSACVAPACGRAAQRHTCGDSP